MPGADEGGHSPTLLHELLAEARGLGFLGPGSAGAADSARPRVLPPSPDACPPTVRPGSSTWVRAVACRAWWWRPSGPRPRWRCWRPTAGGHAFLRRAVERLGLESRVIGAGGTGRGLRAGRRACGLGSTVCSPDRSGVPPCWRSAPLPSSRSGRGCWSPSPHARRAEEDEDDRWPAWAAAVSWAWSRPRWSTRAFEYRMLRQVEACPERFPRRNGVPAKKPLF